MDDKVNKQEYPVYTGKRRAKEILIGLIACDIRGNWADKMEERIEAIRKLSGHDPFTPDSLSAIYYDGRWFRDVWDGSYGASAEDLVWIQAHYPKLLLKYVTVLTEPPNFTEEEASDPDDTKASTI